jgi:hypothetical protein
MGTSHHLSSLSFPSLYFTSLPFTLHHFTFLHFTSLHFPSLHITSLPFTSLHFPSLDITSHHFVSHYFNLLHFTSLWSWTQAGTLLYCVLLLSALCSVLYLTLNSLHTAREVKKTEIHLNGANGRTVRGKDADSPTASAINWLETKPFTISTAITPHNVLQLH